VADPAGDLPMLIAETQHAESARYAAGLVCVPGLWAGPSVWRGFASYLGHRGWESHLVDVRPVGGGIAGRAAAVAEYLAALPGPAVVLGHDAGALVAAAAAALQPTAAVVLVAPLVPGSRGMRRLCFAPRPLLALVRGGALDPPSGRAALAWLDVPDPSRSTVRAGLEPEDAAAVRDVVWNRVALSPPGVPALVVAGERDALLPASAAAGFAAAIGADVQIVPGAGHWLLAGPSWQPAVTLLHRWLVQRLGAGLLEFYEEAMAERDAEDDAGE